MSAANSTVTGSINRFTTKDTYTGSSSFEPPVGDNTTDIIYQSVKLFIEGVEVPFDTMSINQTMGSLPTCEFTLIPQVGIMDIVRYYQPKVHVFYTDNNTGTDKLLFWGHVVSTAYSKSREASGSSHVSFRCRHKNHLAKQISLEFAGYVNDASTDGNSNQVALKSINFNSETSVVTALKGITGVQKDAKDWIDPSNDKIAEADVTLLDPDFQAFEKRLIGMPSVVMNLWNQLKKAVCTNPTMNMNMLVMYIPLFEQGISYLKRLSGHNLLEAKQDASRVDYCRTGRGGSNSETEKVMVPPAYRGGTMSAIQPDMAVKATIQGVQFSNELTDFASLCEKFFQSIEYEIVTLASPAEVPLDPTVQVDPDSLNSTEPMMAIETVVKPQLPFYYSPICNVIFPRMFSSISIDQDEESIPTRVIAYHTALPDNADGTQITANYRAPNSIREAESLGWLLKEKNSTDITYSLRLTTGTTYNIPGKYEQGRGIVPSRIVIPWWLVMLAKSAKQSAGSGSQEAYPQKGTAEYEDMILQVANWVDRYGYNIVENDSTAKRVRNAEKDNLNPFSIKSEIQPHERLLLSSADYEYTKQVARSRNGIISCVFNPYIIPGYPMDVIDDSPGHPSFHGLCTSVTHTITGRSITTNVGMAAAMTYTEMSNYYIQPLHPWLQTALGLVNSEYSYMEDYKARNKTGATDNQNSLADQTTTEEDIVNLGAVSSTLISNPKAKDTADSFYRSVFGVGAADPTDMYDFGTGQAIPQARYNGILGISSDDRLPTDNGGESNDWLTTVGNLRLVSRPIEGKDSIASKFGYKFIDMNLDNYTGSVISYSNPKLSTKYLAEPGASLFLDYIETSDFVKVGQILVDAKSKEGKSTSGQASKPSNTGTTTSSANNSSSSTPSKP